jgi:hypothetical protein
MYARLLPMVAALVLAALLVGAVVAPPAAGVGAQAIADRRELAARGVSPDPQSCVAAMRAWQLSDAAWLWTICYDAGHRCELTLARQRVTWLVRTAAACAD